MEPWFRIRGQPEPHKNAYAWTSHYASSFWETPPHYALMAQIVKSLIQNGARLPPFYRQPLAGVPDIVTTTHIYEVKPQLTSNAIKTGVGQLLMYGQDLPKHHPVLIGYVTTTVSKLRPYVERLGIRLQALEQGLLAEINVSENDGEMV